ncbi:hypothetical protein KC331_g11658 [Hortaea werneckii]|uniref:FAD-binding PCMH-type domain-containing protein n=1 Tax=Hortaea werneckii TaxID=91943 RepID=A0A3M7CTV0_HORWE|nr:hypothetical protein KC331_g11658 [Hortaea werneckii]KAI7708407.1 hypothetical protein KC353_g11043 [Hortaea werneckii]RMY55106.1 hypothetical protein D0865_04354 [Hortaea werneckii]
MRVLPALFTTIAALPISSCEDFDTLAALANYGVNASNFFTGGSRASIAGNPAENDLAARDESSGCKYACGTLSLLYHGNTAYPKSPAYHLEEAGYWSAVQAEVEPYCFFEPEDSVAVAVTILLSRLTQCPFAVKSGGHAAFANASNIAGGITINMARMNKVKLSEDESVAKVGPGNTWYDVYTALEDRNLTVIGGRVADIGVGGLTLGGGVSFFSGLYGWACDNVKNYQVVTAQGTILDVNHDSHFDDLYYALRGGGNNFGVVTRFDLYTYPQGMMWGGSRVYSINETDTILNALVDYAYDAPSDPNAALIVAFTYAEQLGGYVIAADLEHAKPKDNPPIFDAFQNTSYISDTTKIVSLPDLTLEFNSSNPGGLRETYWTATYKVNLDLLQYMVAEYQTQTNKILDVAGLGPSFVLQIIRADELRHMTRNGGNALGLSEEEGPLLLLNIAFWWNSSADDERVLQTCQTILDNTVAYAAERELAKEYRYMNYASQYQKVVPSYGAANHARLREIATKYDPSGVFQRLQPGYFKLDGAPRTGSP